MPVSVSLANTGTSNASYQQSLLRGDPKNSQRLRKLRRSALFCDEVPECISVRTSMPAGGLPAFFAGIFYLLALQHLLQVVSAGTEVCIHPSIRKRRLHFLPLFQT